MDFIERAMRELSDAEFRTGAPQSEAQIDALEKAVECTFPADYREFLATYGGLEVKADSGDMYGSLLVWGAGIEGGDLKKGRQILGDECASWSRDRLEMVPFFGHWPHDVTDAYLFDAQGAVYFHYRGTAEARPDMTFTSILSEMFELLGGSLEDKARAENREAGIIDGLEGMFRFGTSCRRAGNVLYVTNEDGIEVEIRMGDGREFHVGLENLPGLFYAWREPAAGRTPRDLFATNRDLYCARGSLDGDEVRYRGRILVEGLELETVAHVLQHDAKLGGTQLRLADPVDAEEMLSYLQEQAESWSSDIQSVEACGPTTWTLDCGGSREKMRVEVALADGTAWLTTRLTGAEASEDVIIETLNGYNRGLPLITTDNDVNLDLEHFARASVEGAEVLVEHRVLANAFEAKHLRPFLNDIEGTVRYVREDLDIREPLPFDEYEALLGMKLGPLTKAIVERRALMRRAHKPPFAGMTGALTDVTWIRDYGEPLPEAYDSSWGRVRPFLSGHDRHGLESHARIIALVEGGETTDECVCISYPAYARGVVEAVVVAANLTDYLSLLVLGTTGSFVTDETSAQFVRRAYFETFESAQNLELTEWFAEIGVEAASDPLAVVEASGLVRAGTVDLTHNLAIEEDA